MGIIVNKEQEKSSDLDSRITADLREKVQESSLETPDFAEDVDYVKDTKKIGKFGWVWAVLVILAIASVVVIITI